MKKLFLSSLILASLLFIPSAFAQDPIATFTEAFRATDQTCCANRGMPAYFDYFYLRNADKSLSARVRCEGGFWGGGERTLSVHISAGANFKMTDAKEYKVEFETAEDCQKAFEDLDLISVEAPFIMDRVE